MRLYRQTVLGLARTALALAVLLRPALADPPTTPKSSLKPDVAALLKQSTEAYKKMKTYRHTALVVMDGQDPKTGVIFKQKTRFTLALERPNKFVYKDDTTPMSTAVSDGKTFINFRGDEAGTKRQYTKQNAPADYKGINIVDDVNFDPLATYVIALMLQGDPLADKDVKAALEKATLKPGIVTENGKKWQVMSMPWEGQTDLYFNVEDHLIGKAVWHLQQLDATFVETYENVSINKPIPAAVFQYTPPANAQKIEKFPPTVPTTPAQKLDDARNSPRRNSRSVLTHLSADRQPTPHAG